MTKRDKRRITTTKMSPWKNEAERLIFDLSNYGSYGRGLFSYKSLEYMVFNEVAVSCVFGRTNLYPLSSVLNKNV